MITNGYATSPRKRRTITLTGVRPVTIYEDEWPIIASADREADRDDARLDWTIKVREHDDGRRIVYGIRRERLKQLGGARVAGGRLIGTGRPGVPDDEATIRAIREVATVIDCAQLGDECIASLPPVQI